MIALRHSKEFHQSAENGDVGVILEKTNFYAEQVNSYPNPVFVSFPFYPDHFSLWTSLFAPTEFLPWTTVYSNAFLPQPNPHSITIFTQTTFYPKPVFTSTWVEIFRVVKYTIWAISPLHQMMISSSLSKMFKFEAVMFYMSEHLSEKSMLVTNSFSILTNKDVSTLCQITLVHMSSTLVSGKLSPANFIGGVWLHCITLYSVDYYMCRTFSANCDTSALPGSLRPLFLLKILSHRPGPMGRD